MSTPESQPLPLYPPDFHTVEGNFPTGGYLDVPLTEMWKKIYRIGGLWFDFHTGAFILEPDEWREISQIPSPKGDGL